MKQVECLAIGNRVYVGPENDRIEAEILAVTVRAGGNIQYQIAYWSGKERKEVWVCGSEVKPRDRRKSSIGFSLEGLA